MNCRNGEKYIKKSLDSILNQSYKNWELVFFDNKSSDVVLKLLKNLMIKELNFTHQKKRLVYMPQEMRRYLKPKEVLLHF